MAFHLKFVKSILRTVPNFSPCPCTKLQITRTSYSDRVRVCQFSTSIAADDDPPGSSGEQEEVTESKKKSKKREINCPENARLLKVSVVGAPNAGKSTLINRLMELDVCPVSRKPHTTRQNQQAIYLNENTQLVFVDTPGLVTVKDIKKFSFTDEFVYGPEKSFPTSHMIAVVHDISPRKARDRLDVRVRNILTKHPNQKSILIVNKIDHIRKKRELLDCMKYLTCGVVGGKPLPIITFEEMKKTQSHLKVDKEVLLKRAKERAKENAIAKSNSEARDNNELADNLAMKLFTPKEIENGMHKLGWPHFNDVFMISALNGDGIELIRDYMIQNAVSEKWLYEADILTNIPAPKLAEKILRSKLLDHLPNEIPFAVKLVLEFWDENEIGETSIFFKIVCPREQYQYRILGTNRAVINRIKLETEQAICQILGRQVVLNVEPVYQGKSKND